MDSYFSYAWAAPDLQLIFVENRLTGTPESLRFSYLEWNPVSASWSELKALLCQRYSSDYDTLAAHCRLRSLCQTGSVQHYTTQFNMIAATLRDTIGDQALLLQYAENLSESVKKVIATVPGNVTSLQNYQEAALQYDGFLRATADQRPSALAAWSGGAQGDNPHSGRGRTARRWGGSGPCSTRPNQRPARGSGPRSTWPNQRFENAETPRTNNAARRPRHLCKFCRSPEQFPSDDCPLIPADCNKCNIYLRGALSGDNIYTSLALESGSGSGSICFNT
ncbi:MAG: hypothetical protein BJ554DRAFT_682 [Olpidium bornovanus]|uniref:Retrotransposon gag domain-containing protein n=1 Tax=Olpidium bornovanus TaxID=278681 RepID=A0A8H8DMF8_9FUNG|nr:MAG: hypothetical protein BJ554DRAFT_682 [Olpidium bornovanus]